MATIQLDIALFRQQFPQFADETEYPDAIITVTWDIATCYVSDNPCGPLPEKCRQTAINMMVAHLLTINDQLDAGNAGGIVTSSTVGSVSVSLQAPTSASPFQYWLNKTPYGQQLLSLLSAASVGGFYLGGRNERGSFRKAGGLFG